MKILFSFILLVITKIFANIFYRLEVNYLSDIKGDYDKTRIIIFLNHTSLYEPLYIGALPFWFIFRLSRKMVAPAADQTINRPIAGFFYRLLGPGVIPITRKRDKSWAKFLEKIKERSIIVIAPEGRMKRVTGLDKNGKPMTIRSGVAEIMNELNEGRMVIAYSGGLHHVQHPGQFFPRLFKKIKINIEIMEITEYKKQFSTDGSQLRKDIIADLQSRLDKNCPTYKE